MASVQDLLDELNDHGFTDTSVARKVGVINDTVWDIDSRRPWKYLESTTSLTFDGTSPNPTNFPTRFRALTALVRSDGTPVEPERRDVMLRRYGPAALAQPGSPVNYYFLGRRLYVFYVPSASDVLTMDYLQKQAALTQASVESDILLPPEHHRAIFLGAVAKLYNMDDDYDIGASYTAQYEQRIVTMSNELEIVQFDRPERIYDVDEIDLEFLY